jgi:hypothetical protein
VPTLIFFPWLRLQEPLQIGTYRWVPYEPENEWPLDVRQILNVYRTSAGGQLEWATLLEIDGQIGGELDDKTHREALALREVVSFAALRARSYFSPTGYVNDHTFKLVAQNYVPGSPGRASTSRRRDGRARTYHLDDPGIPCPEHVVSDSVPHLDLKLINTLWSAVRGGDQILEALEFFTLANTDDPEIREHTELMLMVAATQRILGVVDRAGTRNLEDAIAQRLDEVLPPAKSLTDSAKALPKTGQSSLRSLWFWDLYRQRGSIAHGRKDGIPNPIWSVREHLLLAAFIFPLLVLARLRTMGTYQLTDDDMDDFAACDHLLCLGNVFASVDTDRGTASAFCRARNEASRERLRSHWLERLRGIDPGGGSTETS